MNPQLNVASNQEHFYQGKVFMMREDEGESRGKCRNVNNITAEIVRVTFTQGLSSKSRCEVMNAIVYCLQ